MNIFNKNNNDNYNLTNNNNSMNKYGLVVLGVLGLLILVLSVFLLRKNNQYTLNKLDDLKVDLASQPQLVSKLGKSNIYLNNGKLVQKQDKQIKQISDSSIVDLKSISYNPKLDKVFFR
jgi:hypothetical protein